MARCTHNPSKNVLWIARDAGDIAEELSLDNATVRLTIAKAKEKVLAARQPASNSFH